MLVGLRKYSIMVIIIIVAVVFRLSDHISGDNLTELLKTVGAAFMASNMVEHVITAVKEKFKK